MAKSPRKKPDVDLSLDERKFRWERTKFLITAVGGLAIFLIGLWQFNITSRNDIAKPVLENQIELCIEASETAATLAQDPNQDLGPDNATALRYLNLYYGRLAVVEDQCLLEAMVRYKAMVFDKDAFVSDRDSKITPSRAALRITFACRRILTKGWNVGLLEIYDPQNLAESFNDLAQYKADLHTIPRCRDD